MVAPQRRDTETAVSYRAAGGSWSAVVEDVAPPRWTTTAGSMSDLQIVKRTNLEVLALRYLADISDDDRAENRHGERGER